MQQQTLEPAKVIEAAPTARQPVLPASAAVLPARIFLGIVFLAAGIDKLTDPQFFNPAASGYIGNQLAGFATVSPIGGFLTNVAVPNATLFGWLSALGEIAIGLGTLAGLFSRTAALGGMILSLTLWLSASWATNPFYLGSDLPYAMFFLVLAIGGAHPVYSLDGQIARWRARQKTAELGYRPNAPATAPIEPAVTPAQATGLARRRFLAVTGATIAAGTFGIVAWGNTLASRKPAPVSSTSQTNSGNATTVPATSAATSAASTTAPASSATAATTAAAATNGTIITNLSALPAGTGQSFKTPDTNEPFLIIRGEGNTVNAFSAICTHQGCTVAFNQSANSIICPCHGAEYNPATGAVTQGPATRALPTVKVSVDASGNVIYTKA